MNEPITNRRSLIDALRLAADLEHDVICRYLFAAFSLKTGREEGGVTDLQLEEVRTWRTAILRVAREEMGHLGFVCNLLTAIGAPPRFTPPPRTESPRLRPFSADVIESFEQIERDHDPDAGPGTIGALYGGIREGFETVGRNNPLLFVGAPEAQVDNASLDVPPGWFDFNLHRVVNASTALGALDRIVEESDGSDAAGHAEVFDTVRTSFLELARDDPAFAPVRLVAVDPSLRTGRRSITHPVTRLAAGLFNTAYEVMLMMMLRFYGPADETSAERDVLQKTAFFPLMTMVLRPLGELLTSMPLEKRKGEIKKDAPQCTAAGPTFECRGELGLSMHRLGAWTMLQERLDDLQKQSGRLVAEMHRTRDAWNVVLLERAEFLDENLARIAANFRTQMNAEPDQVRHLLRRLV